MRDPCVQERNRAGLARIARVLAITLLAAGSGGVASRAGAAIAYVQRVATIGDYTTHTVTTAGLQSGVSTTAGNSILVSFAMPNVAGALTCADSKGNVYTKDADVTNAGGIRTAVFSSHNTLALAPGNTVTVTSPSVSQAFMSVHEFSGLASVAPLDQTKTATGNSAAPSSGATAATTQPSELLYGAIGFKYCDPSIFSPGALYTASPSMGGACGGTPSADRSISTEYRVVSSTGSYAADATLSVAAQWAAAIVTYKGKLPSLSGTVFDDLAGDALASGQTAGGPGNPGVSGVTVRLYSDNGDGLPGAGDALVQTTATVAAGGYTFSGVAAGTYWVAVNSRSMAPSSALNGGFAADSAWAEQTYGPGNCRCADGAGGTATRPAGPCYGGQRWNQSDDPSTLAGAEHVAQVVIAASDVSGENFGFSFDAVTNERGGDGADDDPGANRTVQGSLRQFIQNANAIAGANAMRFVPAGPANASGGGGSWWRIGVTAVLPSVTDAATTIDGAAYALADGTTARDDNPGQLGTGGTVGVDALALGRVNRPELEIQNVRPTAIVALGLDLQANSTVVRNLAIDGFGNDRLSGTGEGNIRITNNASGVLVENDVIGSAPGAFADPGPGLRTQADGIVGVGSVTNLTIRDNLIGFGAYMGILSSSGAPNQNWTLRDNEIRGNGIGHSNQDGISFESGSGGSTIDGNLITGNEGNGIDSPGAGGALTIVDNTITGNGIGITANLETPGIRLFASGSTVDRNVLAANFGAGVMVEPAATGIRITRNSIRDNGTILDLGGGGPSGQIGIDLLTATDLPKLGTAPFFTLNDSGDTDAGGNDLVNYPILSNALIAGGNLVLQGYSRPGALIEVFVSAPDASGFGEGQTYLMTLTEGGTGAGGNDPYADTDGSSGVYGPGAINGVVQGTDNTHRFTFTMPMPPGVGGGSRLTATATVGGETSEFGGNVTVSGLSIVKRAFRLDGTAIPSGTVLPKGTLFGFLVYVNNSGGAVSDVSLQDVLDPAFAYLGGSIRYDNSRPACATGTCTGAEEAAIFTAATAASAGSDAVDGDVVGVSGAILSAGNQTAANAQLDIAAGKVFALAFSVRMR